MVRREKDFWSTEQGNARDALAEKPKALSATAWIPHMLINLKRTINLLTRALKSNFFVFFINFNFNWKIYHDALSFDFIIIAKHRIKIIKGGETVGVVILNFSLFRWLKRKK